MLPGESFFSSRGSFCADFLYEARQLCLCLFPESALEDLPLVKEKERGGRVDFIFDSSSRVLVDAHSENPYASRKLF